jgi:hypothetical protein
MEIITDKEELLSTSPIYDENINDWSYWGKAYDGGTKFIEESLIRNTRETKTNWEERVKAGVNFNYSAIIVDLFSFYLCDKPPRRDMKELSEDKQWQMFKKDCDFFGTDFEDYINNSQKLASVYGAVGILIDKPGAITRNRAQELEKKIYPYCATYTLPNIPKWRHVKNPETGRYELEMVKLKNFDGTYTVWGKDEWHIYRLEEDKNGKDSVILVNKGKNPLGEIPFIWFLNMKNLANPFIGVSDIKEVSRLTGSLIRDLSCGDEIIKYAGFPMMRAPMESETEKKGAEQILGQRGVLDFDAELGEAGKPDWLKSESAEPIDAILRWMSRKIAEIFQMSYLSGVQAHQSSDQARSGVALKYEYQQLGRVLSKKSENMTDGELKIIEFWLKWQKKESLMDIVEVEKNKEYSIDDMDQTLENYMKARQLVFSETFLKEIGKTVAKKILPEATDNTLNKIIEEIEKEKHLPLNQSAKSESEVTDSYEDQGDDRSGEEIENRDFMSLSAWAKKMGMEYHEAYRKFKEKTLPVESQRTESGRIIVFPG